MFDPLSLMDTRKSIPLVTRERNPIPNDQAVEPDDVSKYRYNLLRERFGKGWIANRKGPCGVYNCFGLAFASRRTSIREDDAVELVLKDDGYRSIMLKEVVAGDVVLYREKTGLLHVSLVLQAEHPANDLSRILVLSKWNDCSGEDIHWYQDVPYSKQGAEDYKIEFWTDRQSDGI